MSTEAETPTAEAPAEATMPAGETLPAGHTEAPAAEDRDPTDWGNTVARNTFIVTAVGAALFIGAVVIFIL